MRKRPSSLLWFLWLLLVVQGGVVTPIVKSNVTITLANKQQVTLCFESFLYDNAKPFRTLLEKLKAGEEVDMNESLERNFILTPLKAAINYALGHVSPGYTMKGSEDKYFYAARYLLEHGADPNIQSPLDWNKYQCTAMHELCDSLWFKREVGIRGLALFLSYGARLDIEDKEGERPIDIIENTNPWIPEELRKQYEEKVEPDPAQEGKKKPLDKEEKPYSPPAWTTKILPDEQKELKQKYFLDVLKELRELEKHKTLALDSKSLEYIEERAGAKLHQVQ